MAASGEDSSFLAYTAGWTKAINRDGHLDIVAYIFYRAMKGQVRTCSGHIQSVALHKNQRF